MDREACAWIKVICPARLGFSIAAHLEAGILLLDEVLALGDAKFQKKCQRRILKLKASGTTIVFISHDLVAVRALCDRALSYESLFCDELTLGAGRLLGKLHD